MIVNQLITWQNIYYHYAKCSKDGSFLRLFDASRADISAQLALEDGSHTPSKKGAKKSSGNTEKEPKLSAT